MQTAAEFLQVSAFSDSHGRETCERFPRALRTAMGGTRTTTADGGFHVPPAMAQLWWPCPGIGVGIEQSCSQAWVVSPQPGILCFQVMAT